MVNGEECYSKEKLTELFTNAGLSAEIALSYELLIVAYRAVIRHDFRSAIILAGTALEESILNRIQQYYIENHLTTFKKDKKKHTMLGRKFKWLEELRISIPISDYKTGILYVRNPVTHGGKKPILQRYDEVFG